MMKSKTRAVLIVSAFAGITAAAPLGVEVSDPKACSPMTVSWDASKGSAPWTVTVAPLNHVPTTVELPKTYLPSSSQMWSWQWDVPIFSGNAATQLLVAVSDASGKYSGTSSLKTIATEGGSCASSVESLDFVWYIPNKGPDQCDDWKIAFQEDKGNSGLELPVNVAVLPVQGEPSTISTTSRNAKSLDWTINYPAGTQFTLVAYDKGKSGTGGVGVLYTVGDSKTTSCLSRLQRNQVIGLPAATSTVTQQATSISTSPVSASSRMSSARKSSPTHSSSSTSHTSSGNSGNEATEQKSSHAGVIGGVVGGVLAAILGVCGLGAAFVLYRRKKAESDVWTTHTGIAAGGSPSRGGGFSKRWTPQAMGKASHKGGRNSDDFMAMISPYAGAASVGHASSVSLHRGHDSLGGGNGSVLSHAHSVHSTVPDEALFPPPLSSRVVPDSMLVPPLPPNQSRHLAGIQIPRPNVNSPGSAGSPRTPEEAGASHYPWMSAQGSNNHQGKINGAPSSSARHPSARMSAALGGLPLSPSSAYSSDNSPGARVRALSRSTDDNRDTAQLDNVKASRIAPPTPATTSLFDPYTHMSQLYDGDMQGRILAAGMATNDLASFPGSGSSSPRLESSHSRGYHGPTPMSPRYADPREGAARLKNLEVQLLNERKRVVSSSSGTSLPYM
ncbi:hypothetical protein IE53DRAFT_59680 [Violaceomyces palustris]|uniref:Uncharacterized protein n=1 Tax=Violaceomyces palustris TaxID=1673888 RepID=A0ACD0P7C1_9BASI|nr:hypothetical protein IE53DRAFT_59680 [Violaceomyces palustris]